MFKMEDMYIPDEKEMSERENIMNEMVEISKNCTLEQFFDLLNKLIPDEIRQGKQGYEIGFKRDLAMIIYRQDFNKISWSIPTIKAVNEIYEFVNNSGELPNNNRILEVGAGTGLWSRLLNLKGVNVKATDIGSVGNYFNYDNKTSIFYPIEFINGVEAVKEYSDYNVLFMSWPSMNALAHDTLKDFKGDKLIYIGEGQGGCTADDNFFELLDRQWVKVTGLSILQWNGLKDKHGSGLFVRKY